MKPSEIFDAAAAIMGDSDPINATGAVLTAICLERLVVAALRQAADLARAAGA